MKLTPYIVNLITLATGIILALPALDAQQISSSRAYTGHETDLDANNFAGAYPSIIETRLDDCQTCHRAGIEGTDTARVYNACGYCHLIPFPEKGYLTGVPENFMNTLNAYGRAYGQAGRTTAALREIENRDTDEDGYTNSQEIAALRYPGDATSKPGQPLTPFISMEWDSIVSLPPHEQSLLQNTNKQQFDDYIRFYGVKVKEVLDAAGADLEGATGITVFAPDGYSQDFSMREVLHEFPRGIFYHVPDFIDPEQRFVTTPSPIPKGWEDGEEIPDPLWLMIAYSREGEFLPPAHYEADTGRLSGAGPYRMIAPQNRPGRPDRGSKSKRYNDRWDFDESLDHNAGKGVRGVCVIRVNPVPEGYEEYDWRNGWSLVQDKKMIIYGHSIGD
ncbi:MAG: hypothetical protein JW896_18825 [Deltaproteobacteria bacterium]|nr:hypothetical protein [Deltaproteobacteria bacterium]